MDVLLLPLLLPMVVDRVLSLLGLVVLLLHEEGVWGKRIFSKSDASGVMGLGKTGPGRSRPMQ